MLLKLARVRPAICLCPTGCCDVLTVAVATVHAAERTQTARNLLGLKCGANRHSKEVPAARPGREPGRDVDERLIHRGLRRDLE